MNTNILEAKQKLISAYEVVLKPNSSAQERKDAESVKQYIRGIFVFNLNFSTVKG